MDKKDEPDRGGGGCAIALVIVLMLLPVVYAIGFGPAVWLHKRDVAPEAIEAIYNPLIWAAEAVGQEDRLEQYADWWQ